MNVLAETESCYAVAMKVEKIKVIRILRQPSAIQIFVDLNDGGNVEYFTCLSSMITNDARCTREIKSRIAMAKATFDKKKTYSPCNWASI